MLIEIGHVEAIFRYPVKSMAGERLEAANLGWHGLDGDRRLAFRRINDNANDNDHNHDRSGFPWLSASKLPDLLVFTPHRNEDAAADAADAQGGHRLPTQIRPPHGGPLRAFPNPSANALGARRGAPCHIS